jgi:hypothetical protein
VVKLHYRILQEVPSRPPSKEKPFAPKTYKSGLYTTICSFFGSFDLPRRAITNIITKKKVPNTSSSLPSQQNNPDHGDYDQQDGEPPQ